jgi:ribosomal protein S27E
MGIDNVARFDYISPPSVQMMVYALEVSCAVCSDAQVINNKASFYIH